MDKKAPDGISHSKPKATCPHLGDMDPAEFRQAGYKIVDWISDYLKNTF
jgi:hypothetical protein